MNGTAAVSPPAGIPWDAVTLEHMEYVLGPVSRGNNAVWLQRWSRMQNVVRPYKAALGEYEEGMPIQVHPYLLLYERKLKVQEGFLQLGFVVGEQKGYFIRHPAEADRMLQRKKTQRKKRKPNPDISSQQRLNAQALRLAAHMATPHGGDAAAWDEERSETATYTGSEWSCLQEAQVADLESKIFELTQQIRVLKARRGDHTRPVAFPVILGSRFVACTDGSDVTVELNYLDPDRAPYYVICDSGGNLLPCVVFSGRFITFQAPAHPKGCVPLTVMCEYPPGTLQRYCKSVWLEYKTAQELKAENETEAIPMTSPAHLIPFQHPTPPVPPVVTEPHPTQSQIASPSPAIRKLVRRGQAKHRVRESIVRPPSQPEDAASPDSSPAPPHVPLQASPGNRCVSWLPVHDEEDISTEGSASLYMRSKSCDPDFEDYYNLFEDADIGPETTSNHSKPTSYSSGSEAGNEEGNDDADSLSRGQGSTISNNPSICSRCTSVSRASSIQRARVIESLRSLAISYTTTPVVSTSTSAPEVTATSPVPIATGFIGPVSIQPQTPAVPQPTTTSTPAVAMLEENRILLTRNVLEWHTEETGGIPSVKASAPHQRQLKTDGPATTPSTSATHLTAVPSGPSHGPLTTPNVKFHPILASSHPPPLSASHGIVAPALPVPGMGLSPSPFWPSFFPQYTAYAAVVDGALAVPPYIPFISNSSRAQPTQFAFPRMEVPPAALQLPGSGMGTATFNPTRFIKPDVRPMNNSSQGDEIMKM